MERVGVCVKNGVVVNRIIWSDETESQLADDGYDHYEETTSHPLPVGIDWTWNQTDGYRPPKPYLSWVWSGEHWDAPVAEPSEGGPHTWNETTQTWEAITPPATE